MAAGDARTDHPSPPGRLNLRWDGVVTAGNALTLIGMVSAVLIWGIRLEGRVDHESQLRTRLEAQVQQDRKTDDRLFEVVRQEIRVQGEQTRAALDRLADKLERKADRP
jgi:hypothetical protein